MKVAASTDQWFDRGNALCALGCAHGAAGDMDGARASFARARQDASKGIPKDERDDGPRMWKLLQAIVKGQAQTGNIDAARATLKAM